MEYRMNNEDKTMFIKKIRTMLLAVDNNHVPDKDLIAAYALALRDFSLEDITKAIGELMALMDSHITPAHIGNHIRGITKKLSDSEMRSGAHRALSRPHWERMGFESEAEYTKANHKKWLEDHEGERH